MWDLIIEWFSNNWPTLLSALAVSGIGASIVSAALNYRYTKKINDHVERLKFSLQTEIINAQHIIPERNEAYKKLSNLLEYAYSSVRSQLISFGPPSPWDKTWDNITSANNFLIEHAIYVSPKINDKVFKLCLTMKSLMRELDTEKKDPGKGHMKKADEGQKMLEAMMPEVRTLLHNELWEGLRIK